MAKSKSLLSPDLVADVKRLLELHSPRDIIQAVHENAPKGRGRPPEADSELLRKMANLLRDQPGLSERATADAVAKEEPGHSRHATARRLRRKFGQNREELFEEARFREALAEAPDPGAAADLLKDHLAQAVETFQDSSKRDVAADALKRRLAAMVDEIQDALDAAAVERSLDGVERPFSQIDREGLFEENVKIWNL